MLREGFDDSLISAFITAISQFRQEFDVDQKEWEVIPVSDIIMTVRTQNLVCAFITMGSPSGSQQERMVRFARAIGFVFDSEFEDVPLLKMDEKTEGRFDELFEEMLDVQLVARHKIITTKTLPRGPKCLNQVVRELEEEEVVELEHMAEKIASCGLEEARVYQIIWDAIEADQLVPIEEDEAGEREAKLKTTVYEIEPKTDDEILDSKEEVKDVENDLL
jgi:hypothetical protein